MKKLTCIKTVSVFILLALFAMPAFSQPARGQGRGQMTEEDVRQRVAAMADTLGLTAEQEKKILAAELDFYQEMKKARQGFDPQTGDREAMRVKTMEMRTKTNETYKNVLTREQYSKYQKIQENRRRQRPPRVGEEVDDRSSRGRGRGGN